MQVLHEEVLGGEGELILEPKVNKKSINKAIVSEDTA